MVTTRHKAAVESGEAPPQARKHYTEIGLEEFEEGSYLKLKYLGKWSIKRRGTGFRNQCCQFRDNETPLLFI